MKSAVGRGGGSFRNDETCASRSRDEMDLDLYEIGRAEVVRKWEVGQVVFILGSGRGFQDSLMWNLKSYVSCTQRSRHGTQI